MEIVGIIWLAAYVFAIIAMFKHIHNNTRK